MQGVFFSFELLRDIITIFVIVKLLVITKQNKVSQQKLTLYSVLSLTLLTSWLMTLVNINIFRALSKKIAIKILSLDIPALIQFFIEMTNIKLSYEYGEMLYKLVFTALQLLIIVSGIIISFTAIFKNPKIVETNVRKKDYLSQLNSKEALNE